MSLVVNDIRIHDPHKPIRSIISLDLETFPCVSKSMDFIMGKVSTISAENIEFMTYVYTLLGMYRYRQFLKNQPSSEYRLNELLLKSSMSGKTWVIDRLRKGMKLRYRNRLPR